MNRKNDSGLVKSFLKIRPVSAGLLVACGVLSNCLAIFLSLSIGTYYESLSHHHSNKGRILHILHVSLPHKRYYFYAIFLSLILAATLFQFLFRFGSRFMALDFSLWLRKKIFRQHIRMKTEAFSQKSIGTYLLRYSGDLKSVQAYLEKGIFQLSSDVFFVVVGITVLFQVQLLASVYVVVGVMGGFVLMHYLSITIKKLESERTDMLASDLAYIHNSLHSLDTIKTWNREYKVIKKLKRRTDTLRRISTRATFWKSLHYVLPFAILFLLLLTVFFTHIKTPAEKTTSFITYILLLLMLFPAIKRVMRVPAIWRTGMNSLNKIELVLQQPLENKQGYKEFEAKEVSIEFKDVSFSYEGKTPFLSNVSFTWQTGKLNYINDANSTAISKLLTRLYEPTAGSILMDGTDIKNFSIKSIRKHIAVCTDDAALEGNTLFKCLFLEKEKNDDEVQSCLRMLQLSVIKKEAQFDLHGNIGRGGSLLLFSDYQKVKLARAILSKKKIMFLAGVIEYLEPAVQKAVITYLETIKNEKTIILSQKIMETFTNAEQSMHESWITSRCN